MAIISNIRKSMVPLCGLALLSFATACQEAADDGDVVGRLANIKINATIPAFEDELATRTSVQLSDGRLAYSWAEGDALGVFPSSTIDSQVKFSIASGSGSHTALFDGGDWKLRSSTSYMTYYPYDIEGANATAEALPATFSGQCQTGNASLEHLGRYDYMAAKSTEVTADGYVNFSMLHLTAFVKISMVVPQADSYRRMKLSGQNIITDATFDLTADDIRLTPTATASDIDLELKDVSSASAGDCMTFYMMMAPGVYTNMDLTFTLEGERQDYIMGVKGRELKPGRAYEFKGEASAMAHPKAVLLDSLKFNQALRRLATPGIGEKESDLKVERIIIHTHSQSTAGQLVSDPDSRVPVYADYDDVSHELTISCKDDVIYAPRHFSFAFAYFKNLTEIVGLENINTSEVTHFNGLFYYDNRLLKLDLRSFDTSKAVTMANMFEYCSELWSVDLDNFDTSNVTSFHRMFYYCRVLPEVDVSHFKTPNLISMISMFNGCENLRSIDLSSFTTDNVISMASLFCDCYQLSGPLNLSHFRTPNLTSLEDTFRNCRKITSLDISGFDTQNVTTMYRTFNSLNNVAELKLGPDFVIINGCTLEGTFSNLGTEPRACTITCRPEVKEKMKLSNKVTYSWNFLD